MTDERTPSPLVPLPARIAVLLSGRGSNFEALESACRTGELPARVVIVVSDDVDAAGLEKARLRGIRAVAVPRGDFPTKRAHENAIAEAVAEEGADVVCLAGFMRLLTPAFIERFPMRILNIHPSLLPSFPGLEAQEQAIRYGVRVSGATVHFVDSGTDTGPIVEQVPVAVEQGDDATSLAARILEVEHRLYVGAVRKVLAGGWKLEGRRVVFQNSPAENP